MVNLLFLIFNYACLYGNGEAVLVFLRFAPEQRGRVLAIATRRRPELDRGSEIAQLPNGSRFAPIAIPPFVTGEDGADLFF